MMKAKISGVVIFAGLFARLVFPIQEGIRAQEPHTPEGVRILDHEADERSRGQKYQRLGIPKDETIPHHLH